MEEERLHILKMVEAGQIGAEDAAQLLASLERPAPTDEGAQVPPTVRPDPAVERWARFWIYPMMAGGGGLILGSLVMALVYASGAAPLWRVCGWLPLLLGMAVMVLALWSRRATWLHLRISEGGQRRMALSFPLPLGLTAWGLRIAQPFVPQLRETGVDEVLMALRESGGRGEPLFIDVQDDEQGERVELYIG